MRTDRPSYGSMVELGWMLVMQMVIPFREPPSELIITVLESSGSTVMEPGNGATTYKNVKYYIQQPTEMLTITYNNQQKCRLLHTTTNRNVDYYIQQPTEMSTITYNNQQKCRLLHTSTHRNVNCLLHTTINRNVDYHITGFFCGVLFFAKFCG